jgi:hypothetical protein
MLTPPRKARGNRRRLIGPHDGRELELMLAGEKALAVFVEVVPPEAGLDLVPDTAFAPYVAAGRIVRVETLQPAPPPWERAQLRRVYFALADERWRIDAFREVEARSHGGWD